MKLIKAVVRRLVEVPGLVTLGHYSLIPCAVGAFGMRVAVVMSGYALAYTVGALMLPFLLGLLAHGAGICDRGKCAVMISTQPTAEAQRQRWWLHHLHHQLRSRLTWALLASWFVLTFVIVNPIASGVPVVALLFVELHAIGVHSRLRPWCPWCNGRGPDDEDELGPPPPGGYGRTVPRGRVKV